MGQKENDLLHGDLWSGMLKFAVPLMITNILYILSGIQDVFSGGIKGFGRSMTAMVNALVGVCLFRVFYVMTVFAAHPTFEVLMKGYPVSFGLTALLQGISFFRIYRRESRIAAQKEA